MIRQAAGPNDHPTGPTFLHLYRILSLYSIIKPPKYGNCTILDKHAPKISVSEIKDIFQGDEENVRTNKLNDLQSKIDMLVEDGQWEADDIFEDHNYNSTTAIDCIVYYACGYISKKLSKSNTCLHCLNALKSSSTYVDVPVAELVNLKTKGGLTHPNIHLFYLLSSVEQSFTKYCGKKQVFDLVIEDIFERHKFTFPCISHKNHILMSIITNYLIMRMRHFAVQDNRKENLSKKKKKLAKLLHI